MVCALIGTNKSDVEYEFTHKIMVGAETSVKEVSYNETVIRK